MESIKINFENCIKNLNPVTWVYNGDDTNTRNIGYIAEELYEIDDLKYVVVLDEEKRPTALRYDLISVYAVEVIKDLVNRVETLEKEVLSLKENNKQP